MKSSFIELEGGRQKFRLIQYLDVKVTMENRSSLQSPSEELLQKVDISKCINQNYESIILSYLMAHLQLNYNIPLQNREIFYYHIEGEVFINCGINPLGSEIIIDLAEIDTKQPLHIRIKNLGLLHIDRFMYTKNTVANIENDKDQNSQENNAQDKGKRSRRTKERRIGHIIQKVIEWRKYYSGTIQYSMQHQKYSLQQAANKVGISKKSLDDYLFQIRFGYRYNFNFNEHYNQKVGILRDFVRQQKKATSKCQIKKRKRNNAQNPNINAQNDQQ